MMNRAVPGFGDTINGAPYKSLREVMDPSGEANRDAIDWHNRMGDLNPMVQQALSRALGAQGRSNLPQLNYADANASRAGQLALLQQMRAGGPSVALMQGAGGIGRLGQQALGAAAGGMPARAAMMQAGAAGAGMAGDVARARLAEQMAQQQALAQGATQMRGGDISQATGMGSAANARQRLNDQLAQFYLSQGMDLANAQRSSGVALDALRKQVELRNSGRQFAAAQGAANTAGTLFSKIGGL